MKIELLGIDRAIAYTVAAKCVAALSAITTILLITIYMTPDEQGYYYTFNSLLAIQVLIEMGLSTVVIQAVAHKMNMVSVELGTLSGDQGAVDFLASALRKLAIWYLVMALFLGVILFCLGTPFLATSNSSVNVDIVQWNQPWLWLLVAFTSYFFLASFFPFFEGMGQVEQVAQIRLIASVPSYFSAFWLIIVGNGLYAPVAIFSISALTYLLWLITGERKKLLGQLLTNRHFSDTMSWKKDIFPMQWRVAISWISGYAIFNLFTPATMYFEGAATAGKVGVTLAALSGITALTFSWASTKAPAFGKLVSNKNFRKLDKLFVFTCIQSSAVYVVLSLLFLFGLLILRENGVSIVDRFLELYLVGLLLFAGFLNNIIFCMAVYLRAHKNEPLLTNSVVSAILIGLCVAFQADMGGVSAMFFGYALVVMFSTVWVFRIYRQQKSDHLIG